MSTDSGIFSEGLPRRSPNRAACGRPSRRRSPGIPAPPGLRSASMAGDLGREPPAAHGGDHDPLPGAFCLRYRQRLRRGEQGWKEQRVVQSGRPSRLPIDAEALCSLMKRWDVVGGFGGGGGFGRRWGELCPPHVGRAVPAARSGAATVLCRPVPVSLRQRRLAKERTPSLVAHHAPVRRPYRGQNKTDGENRRVASSLVDRRGAARPASPSVSEGSAAASGLGTVLRNLGTPDVPPAAREVFQGAQEERGFAAGAQPTAAPQPVSSGAAKGRHPRCHLQLVTSSGPRRCRARWLPRLGGENRTRRTHQRGQELPRNPTAFAHSYSSCRSRRRRVGRQMVSVADGGLGTVLRLC